MDKGHAQRGREKIRENEMKMFNSPKPQRIWFIYHSVLGPKDKKTCVNDIRMLNTLQIID